MALQTANQFQLGTDFSRLGRGAAQGAQLGGQFQQAQQRRRAAQQATDLGQFSAQALTGDQTALGQVAAIDPQRANQIQSFLAGQSEAERAESLRENDVLTRTALGALSLPVEQRRNFLTQKSEEFRAQGRDTSNIDRALAGDDVALNQALNLQAQEGQTIAQLAERQFEQPDKAPVGTASQRDFATFQRLLREDPENAEIFGKQAGFLRETTQEKADIKVKEAERKEVAKANVKRKQGFVDSGITAADSSANIRRSIDLLKSVNTGGFDNIALRVNQLFGVEGANEAELSANLGKNVLAQLKPIFGAAFTAKEGEELKRIEAGFGKSTAGNIRLLERTLRLADRSARRGIAAAEDQGDTFTANEIRSALEFKAEPAVGQQIAQPVQQIDLTTLSDEELQNQLEAARRGQ